MHSGDVCIARNAAGRIRREASARTGLRQGEMYGTEDGGARRSDGRRSPGRYDGDGRGRRGLGGRKDRT